MPRSYCQVSVRANFDIDRALLSGQVEVAGRFGSGEFS